MSYVQVALAGPFGDIVNGQCSFPSDWEGLHFFFVCFDPVDPTDLGHVCMSYSKVDTHMEYSCITWFDGTQPD